MATSNYRLINGMRYDRQLLEIAELAGATKDEEAKLTMDDAQHLYEAIIESNKFSEIEKETLEYIREQFGFEEEADQWLTEELEAWEAAELAKQRKIHRPKKRTRKVAPIKIPVVSKFVRSRPKTTGQKVIKPPTYKNRTTRKTVRRPYRARSSRVSSSSSFLGKILILLILLLIPIAYFVGKYYSVELGDAISTIQISRLESELQERNQELASLNAELDILTNRAADPNTSQASQASQAPQAPQASQASQSSQSSQSSQAPQAPQASQASQSSQAPQDNSTNTVVSQQTPVEDQTESPDRIEQINSTEEDSPLSPKLPAKLETAQEPMPIKPTAVEGNPVINVDKPLAASRKKEQRRVKSRPHRERQTAVQNNRATTRETIAFALQDSFNAQIDSQQLQFDEEDLLITFVPTSAFFEVGSDILNPELKNRLRDFFPKFIQTLVQFDREIVEIRFQGHTSPNWKYASNPWEAYLKNMNLSTSRADSALQFCLNLQEIKPFRSWLRKRVVSVGFSDRLPFLSQDNSKDEADSRRISIAVELAEQ